MAQIIEDIILTDKKAREIVQKAQIKRELILQSAKEEHARLVNEGAAKLATLKQALRNEGDAYKEEIEGSAYEQLCIKKAGLEEQYAQSEQKWVQDIFEILTKA